MVAVFHLAPLLRVVRQQCEGLSRSPQPCPHLQTNSADGWPAAGLGRKCFLTLEVYRKVVPAHACVFVVYWTVFCDQRFLPWAPENAEPLRLKIVGPRFFVSAGIFVFLREEIRYIVRVSGHLCPVKKGNYSLDVHDSFWKTTREAKNRTPS